jgi:hypothetical protein
VQRDTINHQNYRQHFLFFRLAFWLRTNSIFCPKDPENGLIPIIMNLMESYLSINPDYFEKDLPKSAIQDVAIRTLSTVFEKNGDCTAIVFITLLIADLPKPLTLKP